MRYFELRELAKMGLLTIVYFGAAKVGLSVAYINASVSAVWLATGLALSALLLYGWRLWPGILLGAFFANWATTGNFATSLAIGIGNTGEALVGAWLVNRFANGVHAFAAAATIARFILCSAASTLISASVGVASLEAAGLAPWKDYGVIWLTWWLGDLMSNLTLAPALLLWLGSALPRFEKKDVIEAAFMIVAVGLVGEGLFGGLLRDYAMTFLCIPPLLWAACRFHQRGAAIAVLILSVVANVGTVRGSGPFASENHNEALLILQGFMGVISISGLVLGALAFKLKESEGRFRTVIDSAMDAVISIDSGRRVVLFNPAAAKMFAIPASEAVGKPLDRFIFGDFGAHTSPIKKFAEVSVSRRLRGALTKVCGLRANGEEFPIEASISQMEVRGEKLFTVILRDITKRTKAEEHQGRLAAIVDSSEDAIISTNLEGIVTSWNRGAERLFGYRSDEMIGQSLEWIIPAELSSEEEAILDKVRKGEPIEHLETVRRAKDGRMKEISLSVSPVRNAAGVVFGAAKICRDVSKRKEAEEKLRRSEALYRLIARSIPEGAVTVVDSNFRFLAAEGCLLAEGNLGPEKLEGRTIAEVLDQSTAEVIEPRYRRALSGETNEYETRWKERVLWSHYVPLRDENGRVMAAMALSLDITEAKRAEEDLRKSQDELARINTELEQRVEQRTIKLNEMVGELEHFSYTITHDMRAPLRAMQGFSCMLLEESELEPANKALLQRIASAAERMDHLITDALNYSQAVQKELPLQTVDAGALLRGIIESYPQFQPPRTEVEICQEIPLIRANEAGLTQCFSNLLNNAVKFVEPGRTPRIRVFAEVINQEGSNSESSKNHNRVRLWFEDNGIGITAEEQQRIFEMFHRVNRNYEGTGIGLALVRKVVEQMNGRVGVASEPGRGSRFWVELEAAREEPVEQFTEPAGHLVG